MGRNKLMLPYGGKTVIEWTLMNALRNSDRVVVVTGFEREKILPILEKYPVETRFNPDYEKGQKTSSLVAMAGIDDDTAFLPGDMPLVEDSIWREGKRLLGEKKPSRPFWGEDLGSPVFVPGHMMEGLRNTPLPFKKYLKENGIVLFQGTPLSVFDIDTPERYERLLDHEIVADNP